MVLDPKSFARMTRRRLLVGSGALAVPAALGLPLRPAFAQEEYRLRAFLQSTMRVPMEVLTPGFTERYPGSDIRYNFANTDQLHTTARIQLSSGTAPDIISVWPGSGNPMSVHQLAQGGFLYDLSDEPYASTVPQMFQEAIFWDDRMWFYSPSASVIGLYVNGGVRDELGLEQPRTWLEFLAMCEKVKASGRVPIALGTGTPFVTQLIAYALVATTVYSRTPEIDEEMAAGRATFGESEGWHEALEKYLELQTLGFFNENPNGTPVEEQLQSIASGDAAMTIIVSSQNASLFDFAGHKDFIVWPVPALDDADATMVPAGPGAGFGVNAQARDIEGALALLRFLAEPESAAQMSDLTALPYIGAGTESVEDPIFAETLAMITAGRSVPFMDTRWPNPRVQQTLFGGVQELLNGAATPQEVLARMDAAYTGA